MAEADPNDADPALAAQRYRTLIENMSEGFIVCEAIRDEHGHLADYWLRYANPVYVRRAPAGDAVVGRRQRELRPNTGAAWFAACERALAGQPVRFEFQDPLSRRWYEVHMMKLSDSEFGQLFVEVTKRKAAEERQAALFNELNHRVKNNLAIVSAILELQARESPPAVRDHLAKAVDRIHSIADLHAALYQQDSTDTVDLCPYLHEVCERLRRSLLEGSALTLVETCQHVSVPIAEAVNVGLIVNELVTNCAKYAYGQEGGAIRVDLATQETALLLTVADAGRGLPGDVLSRPGLGLRIVRSMTESLGGEVRFVEGPGATVQISLPLASVERSPETQQQLL